MGFRRRVVIFAFGLGLLIGAALPSLRASRAASYAQDTNAAPTISLTEGALLRFWSQQAATRGVTNDAQWNAAMATIFSTANFPGVDTTSLAFLRSFFVQYVHVGVP